MAMVYEEIICGVCGEQEMIGVCETCGRPLCGYCAREFTNGVKLCVPCLCAKSPKERAEYAAIDCTSPRY